MLTLPNKDTAADCDQSNNISDKLHKLHGLSYMPYMDFLQVLHLMGHSES